MYYTKLSFTLIIFLFSANVFSQDTSMNYKLPTNLKKGIYRTFEEFEKNSPSIIDSFFVEKAYKYNESEDGKRDTIFKGYVLKFLDSTKKIKKVYCINYEENLYIDLRHGSLIKFKQYFMPLDFIGRFPFIELTQNKIYFGLGWELLLASIVDDLISKSRQELFYINKKGKLMQATGQAIAFLLKKDKDFLKEFNSEKKYSVKIYRKYLLKMNERYAF